MQVVQRRVWFAKVNRREITLLDRGFADDVAAALDPDKQLPSYGRLWRLSRPHTANSWIFGKLGYESIGANNEAEYNNETKDYEVRTSPARKVNFSQYVLDLDRGFIAFEEKGQALSRKSFLRVMGALIAPNNLEVDALPDADSFREWLSGVDKLTAFSARVRRPNPSPRYGAEELNRILVTEPNAGEARLSLQQRATGEGLDPGSSVVQGIVAHSEEGHADYTARALIGGQAGAYSSKTNLLSRLVEFGSDEDKTSLWDRLRETLVRVKERLAERAP